MDAYRCRNKRGREAYRARTCEPPAALLRSWWFCARAPKGSHLALVLLSWTLLLVLFCMPCLVKGLISRQSKMQDCGDHTNARASPVLDSFEPVISGRLGENKDIQKFYVRAKHICSDPQSLCFQSRLTGFLSEKDKSQKYSDEESVANGGNEQELRKVQLSNEIMGQDYITKSVNFKLMNDRTTVSCFPSPSNKSNKKMSIQMEYPEKTQSGSSGKSSSPNVLIRPSLMEWGPQPLFSPSVAYMTVLNSCNDTALHIFKPFSTNAHFYAYGFEEITVAPGDMVSIAFIFLPRMLGLATGHLILQTSSGGFVILAKGKGVESPYRIEPSTGLNAFSGSLLRDNITLYNPFDGLLLVEEVSAWISSPEASSIQPTGAVCKTDVAYTTEGHSFTLNENAWFKFGKDATDIPLFGIRPSGGWEITPHLSTTIMEIDISTHIEGKVSGALCLLLKNSFQETRDTVIVPLEALIVRHADDNQCDYPMHKDLNEVLSEGEKTVRVALSMKNDGLEVIRLVDMCECSENGTLLKIEFLEGLILLPGTVTYMATVTYKVIEKTNSCKENKVHPSSLCSDCRLLVVTNSTKWPQVELPCEDLIYDYDAEEQNHLSTTGISESFFGLSTTIHGLTESINVKSLFQSIYAASTEVIEGKTLEFLSDIDNLFLKNWKLQGTSENVSVLVQSELRYPMIQIGTKSSKWVHVINPSNQPVVMQLILNSEAISAQCKDDGEVWENWELNHSYKTVTGLLTKAPDGFRGQNTEVFFLPDNGITEAYVQPHGSASFGPIFFQPSKRCVWTSSVFIKNNLSGVDWLHLQGAGGSGALMFLEDFEPIQALHFNINIPTPTSPMSAIKFYSNHIFQMAGMKPACTKPVLKKLLARNTGDLPLEVNAINVAGKACGSNIFMIHPCDSFLLAPGEYTQLLVSYQADVSSAAVSQDLQLAMSWGILVIPLKASLPVCMIALCQSLVLIEVILIVFLAATLLVLWRFLALETSKSTIAEDAKFRGLRHGDPVKQRSMIVLKTPEELAQLKFSGDQCKSHKEQAEQDTETPAKAGRHVRKATVPVDSHEELEENSVISHSKLKHDSEEKSLINSNLVRVECEDKILVSETSDTSKYSSTFAVPNLGCEHAKWLHDGNYKKLSKSSLGGNKSIENVRPSEPSNGRSSFSPNRIPGPMNTSGGSNSPDLLTHMDLLKIATCSGTLKPIKLEKEKEKGRRRRKKSSALTIKHDVSSSQSGNSTPSSPASPLTPVALSGPMSSLGKTVTQSSLVHTSSPRVNDMRQDMEATGNQDLLYEFHKKMPQTKFNDTSRAGFISDACDLDLGEVCVSKQFEETSSKQTVSSKIPRATENSSPKAKPKNTGKSLAVNGDWVTVAKRSADSTLNNSKGIRLQKVGFDSQLKNSKPLLTTSATFPRSRRREPNSGWNHSMFDMKEVKFPLPTSPSLVSTSAIAPHARAPGTKLAKTNSVQVDHDTRLSPQPTGEDSTYDIWGNHFAKFLLPPSNPNSSDMTTGLPSTSILSSSQEYSQSLFAKFAPKSHLDKTFNPAVSSNPTEFCRVFLND
ncbi:uncharacterized protein LOC131061589 [Cryptomeria japonica]|uniref:uncharacterized protein LOC131061589 n=1 Tax=Cryptomeria japonica TaxID=3369 RepID=UPI0027DA509D|nr:uncharacterized protein LOC131061589 [Cryptomeria japonica]